MDLRVLIVDDSITGRKMMRKALPASVRTDVTEAGSGDDALRLCESGAFDVVFLDLTMPGLTGYDVLERLRQQPIRPLVVVVSGDVQALAQERVMSLGAFAFVKKPVQATAIEAVIKGASLQ